MQKIQLDEARDTALARSAKYQQVLRQYHARRICERAFHVGDLGLCLVQSNKSHHKLSPPWEGPFIVAKVLRPGTYKLQTAEGHVFPQRMEHRATTSLLPLKYVSNAVFSS